MISTGVFIYPFAIWFLEAIVKEIASWDAKHEPSTERLSWLETPYLMVLFTFFKDKSKYLYYCCPIKLNVSAWSLLKVFCVIKYWNLSLDSEKWSNNSKSELSSSFRPCHYCQMNRVAGTPAHMVTASDVFKLLQKRWLC